MYGFIHLLVNVYIFNNLMHSDFSIVILVGVGGGGEHSAYAVKSTSSNRDVSGLKPYQRWVVSHGPLAIALVAT